MTVLQFILLFADFWALSPTHDDVAWYWCAATIEQRYGGRDYVPPFSWDEIKAEVHAEIERRYGGRDYVSPFSQNEIGPKVNTEIEPEVHAEIDRLNASQ